MRISGLCAACALLLAVSACEPDNQAADTTGSIIVTGEAAPPTGPQEITFAGAVTGTSQAKHEACETTRAGPDRAFTLTASGELYGRTYFLYLSIYGYAGRMPTSCGARRLITCTWHRPRSRR